MTTQNKARCPCCQGAIEETCLEDGARGSCCPLCGWREHVPASGDLAAARTLQWSRERSRRAAQEPGPSGVRHVCADCGSIFCEGEKLAEIADLWERVLPGDTMPSGQCPECGALCYLDADADSPRDDAGKPTIVVFVRGGVVQAVEGPPSVRVVVCDFDTDGADGGKTDVVAGCNCFLGLWDPPDEPSEEFAMVLKLVGSKDQGPTEG